MGAFGGVSVAKKAASDDIKKWASGVAEVEGIGAAAAVKVALAGVAMRPKQGDARGRAASLFVDIFNALAGA